MAKLKLKVCIEKNKKGDWKISVLARGKNLLAPTRRMGTAVTNVNRLKAELYYADVVLINNNT